MIPAGDVIDYLRFLVLVEEHEYLATLRSEEVRPDGERVNHFHWRRRNAIADTIKVLEGE